MPQQDIPAPEAVAAEIQDVIDRLDDIEDMVTTAQRKLYEFMKAVNKGSAKASARDHISMIRNLCDESLNSICTIPSIRRPE
jgi:ABC-type nitrate/sulfonate/bicarbonate transport system permease component